MQVLIRIKEPIGQFFQRMAEELTAMSELEVKSDIDQWNETEGSPHLGFRYLSGKASQHHGCNFIAWQKNQVRLLVTPFHRSSDAEPDEALFRELFAEPLRQYNRRHSTRYRLTFKIKQLRLTPSLEKAFDSFVNLANMRALHPYDWERFYRFVALSYSRQPDLDEGDVRALLLQRGFNPKQSAHISDVFRHCREFYIYTDPDRHSSWKRRLRRK